MKKPLLLFIVLILCINCAKENEIKSLSNQLKTLEPYIGKTYMGEFANSTPEKPVFDIQKWDRILNGNGVKITHSVNEGEYGGESTIMFDLESNSFKSWYFTTAGFYTVATVTLVNNKIIFVEDVTGNQNGITQVKSTLELLSNGNMHTKAQYLVNGKWQDGHEIHYKEDSQAKVKFK